MSLKHIIADKLLDIYTFPINLTIRKMSRNHKTAFQTKLFKHIKDTDNYVSLSFTPIHVTDLKIGRQTERDFSDTSIVLQGPVAEKNNFTVETVELYKKYYKGIHIVVSTWNNTPENLLIQLRKTGAEVVLNVYPDVNGVGNINYQLVTSLNGVKKAQEYNSAFVWKTRTDQRYYNPCALPCLINSLKDRRLVMLGGIYNSFIKRIFHISDFMAFGRIDEMLTLYGCELDEEDSSRTKYTHKKQARDNEGFNQYMIDVKKAEDGLLSIGDKYDKIAIDYGNPETLITYYYYKKKYNEAFSSLSQGYDEFLKNEIAIIDADSLGFFWLKYEFDSIKQTYFERIGKLDYAKWISM